MVSALVAKPKQIIQQQDCKPRANKLALASTKTNSEKLPTLKGEESCLSWWPETAEVFWEA